VSVIGWTRVLEEEVVIDAVVVAAEEGVGAGVFLFGVVAVGGFFDGLGVSNVVLKSFSIARGFRTMFEGRVRVDRRSDGHVVQRYSRCFFL